MRGVDALAREHLHGFLRALEEAGVGVSPPKQADFLVSLVASPPEDVDGLYWRARVTLVTGAEAFAAFDAVFDAFFRGGRLLLEEEAAARARRGAARPRRRAPSDDGALDALATARRAAACTRARSTSRHARSFAPTSPERARRAARAVRRARRRSLPTIAARRSARARRGRRLDVRRVLAAANRTGGEIVALRWLRRPPRPRRVLLLIDVSGSLRQHSPDLLRFAHEAVRAADRAEAFTFGTRLTRVTGALARRDVDARARRRSSGCVLDADGGTRIGVALQEFLANGRYVALARGALSS